jgi:hypothetical protein
MGDVWGPAMKPLRLLERVTEVAPEEPIKEPAKRWFNWWRCGDTYELCTHAGRPLKPGELYHGKACPTKDTAETIAASDIRAGVPSEWLGAFPEGERP